MSKVKQAKARKVSYTFNFQRYTSSLGSESLNALSNVVVDASLKRALFSKDSNALGYKKRQYYYSRKVLGGYKVQALQINISKASSSLTKRCRNSSNFLKEE